jgi:RHS repeat-associated protein
MVGYSLNGNILIHSDSVMGTWNFSYDVVDRLTAAAQTASTLTSNQYAGNYACWTYDSFGNRTLEAFSTVPCTGSNPTPQAKAVYNPANNQILSVSGTTSANFTYDASGNTTNDGRNQYWYDAEGQLCAVQQLASSANPSPTITQYIYDAEGARIGKGTLSVAPPTSTSLCAVPLSSNFMLTARYLVDLGGDQVTELNEQGMPAPATEIWKHSNVFSAARLTATYDVKYTNGNNTGGLHYELADPLGTKRVQANVSGYVEEVCTSLPFGNDINNPFSANCGPIPGTTPPATADDATEHHFTQKERDTESGNDYFFARYYNSAIGRFTTPDWSAKADPVPYAVFTDPQSLNLYAHVRNNPLTREDADGHDPIGAVAAMETIVTGVEAADIDLALISVEGATLEWGAGLGGSTGGIRACFINTCAG